MNENIIILLIFIFAYIFFIIFPKYKSIISISAAILIVFITSISFIETIKFINWNILGLIAGTLILSELFINSRYPAFLADSIINKSPNLTIAMIFLCILTGFISIFLENVACVLLLAPVALNLCKKAKISPIPLIIAMSLSSNLQGTATLIGDPPSMIMASYQHMTFNDFFFYKGRISIFFFVEAGALASLIVLFFIFKKKKNYFKL